MSRGDEQRRLVQIMIRLRKWTSPSDLVVDSGATRRTVDRILTGIRATAGLERRQSGRRVEYRLER